MISRQLLQTAALAVPIGLIAAAADYGVSGLLLHQLVTPVEPFLLAAAISIPVDYYFISQRAKMRRTQIALVKAQENKDDLLSQLQVALSEAQSATEAKSVFLATMSHEIRTPLNGVLGMAQAMEVDELTATQRDRIQIIRESGQSLLAILNDILDLSKIEAGKLEIEEIDLDLGAIFAVLSATFTPPANKKGISFALDIHGTQGVYRGDPTRLRQILYNLVSNALKFTSSGEIRLVARRLNGGLQFDVSDSGIGMSPQARSSLFTRFKQVDASTTRRFGGTGLGLAICRELVDAMGGEIHVTSEEGIGSMFSFFLPMDYVGAVSDEAPDSRPQIADERPELNVLAAEDNLTNQLVLRTLLCQFGIEPKIVGDGIAAVAAWRQDRYDLILMDVQMPNMDGLAATEEIRRIEVEGGIARTPILALTANAMTHQIKECMSAGMDGFVAKPIEAAKLYDAIANCLI